MRLERKFIIPFFMVLILGQTWLPAASQPDTLNAMVNSVYDEQYPLLSSDGRTLYFVRDKHPNNIGSSNAPDIWISRLNADGSWSRALHLGAPVNDPKPNRLVGVDPDEDVLYLAQNDGHQGWISLTRREGRSWKTPTPMIIQRFVPGASASFSVSADEQYLLIASNQEGEQGMEDLYLSTRLDEYQWSHPINLGMTINTSGKEPWGMLAADGQTLYFASDGHPGGFGGLDLWVSRRKNDSWTDWSKPLNLGPLFNSSADEGCLALSGEGKQAIFSRFRAEHGEDLLISPLAEDFQPYTVAILSGRIRQSSGDPVSMASVFYRDLSSSNAIEKKLNIQPDGTYKVVLPTNRIYSFYGAGEGFLPLSAQFSGRSFLEKTDSSDPQLMMWAGQDLFYWKEEQSIQELQKKLEILAGEVSADDRARKYFRQLMGDFIFKMLDEPTQGVTEAELEVLKLRYHIFAKQSKDSVLVITDNSPPRKITDVVKGATGGDADPSFPEEPAGEEISALKKELRNAGNRPIAPINSQSLKTYSDEFEELKRRAEKELVTNLLPGTQSELAAELFPEIWRAVTQRLDPFVLNRLNRREDSLRTAFTKNLGRIMLAAEPSSLSPADDTDWQDQLKTDLKTLLRPKLRIQLKMQLREYYRSLIQLELSYETKIALQAYQQELMDKKIIAQEKIEAHSDDVGEFLDQVLPAGYDMDAKDYASFLEVEKDLFLQPIENGQILVLHNVNFLPDQAVLQKNAFDELDRLLNFLGKNEAMVIEVRAHTHGLCLHEKALSLTQARARFIADFLLSNGISADRVRYQGFGKNLPLTSNDTPLGRAKNQRIEIKILDTGQPSDLPVINF